MSNLNIAIDGPSGSGKSTMAKGIAKALNIYYLDTGSMYRSVAYAATVSGIDIGDADQVEKLMNVLDLKTVFENGEQINLLNGENVMPFIRTPEISKAASDISAHPCVRLKLVAMQQECAKKYDIVLDGRDIGTYVLPNAQYKFFVTADVSVRAKRRHTELTQKGIKTDYEAVLSEMITRDTNDSTRSFAPLKQADDAILLDTTHLDIPQCVDEVLSRIGRE